MTTSIQSAFPARRGNAAPSLENGDHLDQPTFHARYLAMPKSFRAELIGGVVYVPSPLKVPHGDIHGQVMMWLNIYRAHTPGTQALDNATDILGPDSEPQPDGCLLIKGGQTHTESDYLVGPPEFAVEVASSSEAFDLFEKRNDYERYGITEYLVLVVREARAVWFIRSAGADDHFIEQPMPSDGIFRSKVFPGLWLDAAALFRGEPMRVIDVLNMGLASQEHAAFVGKQSR